MLFFIKINTDCVIFSLNLNTSHVILYQNPVKSTSPPESNLNTSHVILYHKAVYRFEGVNSKFKYISCYSLSGIEPGTSHALPHLNTSHVILYPYRFQREE